MKYLLSLEKNRKFSNQIIFLLIKKLFALLPCFLYDTAMAEENFRINKYIAQTGFCSRRKADELIEAGKVRLNGKVVTDFSTTVGKKENIHIFVITSLQVISQQRVMKRDARQFTTFFRRKFKTSNPLADLTKRQQDC